MWQYQLKQANDWLYYYGVDEHSLPHNLTQLPVIAEMIFPGIANEQLKIVNGNLVNAPMAFPDNRVIFLSTGGTVYYAQTVFQLGHELCHTHIKTNLKDVNFRPNMFWFEEVLCEISSHLFLHRYMTDIGWDDTVDTLPYDQYSKMVFEEVKPFNTANLFTEHSDEIQHFKYNPTDREKIRYVAKLLFPIFLKTPSLLAQAQKLRNLYSISDFDRFLDAWEDSLEEFHKDCIRQIKRCLSGRGAV